MSKIGISVTCATCGRMKNPVGRYGSPEISYCHGTECPGWDKPPYVGQLWPGETEEEYGYPIGQHGVREQ